MNGVRAGPCGHRSRSRRQERAFRDAAGPGGPRGVGGQGNERVERISTEEGPQDRHRGLSLRFVSNAVFRRGGPPWPPAFRQRANDHSTETHNRRLCRFAPVGSPMPSFRRKPESIFTLFAFRQGSCASAGDETSPLIHPHPQMDSGFRRTDEQKHIAP